MVQKPTMEVGNCTILLPVSPASALRCTSVGRGSPQL